jgi:hypothetical protein
MYLFAYSPHPKTPMENLYTEKLLIHKSGSFTSEAWKTIGNALCGKYESKFIDFDEFVLKPHFPV